MERNKWTAPDGATWVCAACGKHGQERDKIGDESCFMKAVLCETSSLMFVDGMVRGGTAISSALTPAADGQKEK